MNGRTRLHRCWESIQVNNGTRIEGVLVRVSGRIKVITGMSVPEYGTGAGIMPGLPVNSSHGHLVTRSCRQTVNSSHARLITQSTRYKRAHNKTTSTSLNYLHAIRRYPETVLNTDGVITRYLCYFNVYCRFQITATDYTSTKSTVNSSQRRETRQSTRYTIFRCDELTV